MKNVKNFLGQFGTDNLPNGELATEAASGNLHALLAQAFAPMLMPPGARRPRQETAPRRNWRGVFAFIFSVVILLFFGLSAFAQSPGGRLTLQSGYPVQNADQPYKSTIFYTCDPSSPGSPNVPIPNGTSFVSIHIPGCEISAGLSPSYIVGSYAFDVLLLLDSGANLQMCTPPSGWNAGSRSGLSISHLLGGASYAAFHADMGYWTNSAMISHCYGGASGTTDYGPVAADTALWVGSFKATAAGQTSMVQRPVAAVGGNNTQCGVVNIYNRVLFRCKSQDATATWQTNSTVVNPIPCNSSVGGGGGNRINFLDPTGDINWFSELSISIVGHTSTVGYFGIVAIGYDTTTGGSGFSGDGAYLEQQTSGLPGNSFGTAVKASYEPASTNIGIHYLQCLEYSNGQSDFNGSDYMMFVLNIWG